MQRTQLQNSEWTGEPPLRGPAVQWFLFITLVWTTLGVVAVALVPMCAPVLLPLSAVAPMAWYWSTQKQFPRHKISPLILVLLGTDIYLLFNATWSQSPWDAATAVAQLFIAGVILHLTMPTLHRNEFKVLQVMAIGVMAGVTVSGAILFVSVFTGLWPQWLIISLIPALQPHPPHVLIENGQVTMVFPHILNRSISVLGLCLWPVLLIVRCYPSAARTRLWVSAALLPSALAILGSAHTTSKIALAGGATAFAISLLSVRFAKYVVAAAWITATLLVVPLAAVAYDAQLYRASWLPLSAQHRIVIWGYTSRQVANAPLLGSGIATARALVNFNDLTVSRAPGTDFQLSTHVHSHNAYLQIWFETGALGASLFLVMGLLVLRTCDRLPVSARPYFYACFSACALLAGSSFSIWAPWLLASYAIVSILLNLGVVLAYHRECLLIPGASRPLPGDDVAYPSGMISPTTPR